MLFKPGTRCTPNTRAPFFRVVTTTWHETKQAAGSAVSWKIDPAVAELWQPQAVHSSSTPRTVHDLPPPKRGHRNPPDHRSRIRYARQAFSIEKEASSSVKFRLYSSTTPAHYPLWSPESSRYPSIDL